MAPARWLARTLALVTLAALVGAPAAHALRIVDYNVLNYPGTTGPTRDPSFRTVLQAISPDVLVTEEMNSQAGVTEFLNSLNTMEPGQWAALPFIDGNDTDCALFYKPSKIGFASQWSFYPNPANLLRLVHVYRIRPVGYSSNAADIRLYAMHLKASTGFESQRLAEATGVRDSMNAMPTGCHGFAVGDFNFYNIGSVEPGLTKLVENQADNDGRLYDPLGLENTVPWQDNTNMQIAWTQSPCKTGDTGCASGAATGGLDDRFDLILPTLNWNDGQGYELIPGSYVSVGNDGLHHNNSIQDPPTIPEGAAYATALHSISDHLPVRIDIQLQAKISVPPSLALGTVIGGGTVNLAVSNPAVPPADALDYAFSPDAGFTAPAGSFSLAAGAPPALQPIGMSGAFGAKSGFLLMSADDPDNPNPTVSLSGTLIDHAQASLDSTSALLGQTLDFGEHAAGEFTTLMARVHDRDYNSLRARLSVNTASIVGGDGRFSIVGGFSTALVSGVAKTYTVQFDDAGATPGTDYDATLTFTSADEALPGSASQPDLTVTLHAKTPAGPVGVGGRIIPAVTRLYPPSPNPTAAGTMVTFDLAHAASLRLEVYDLSGRRLTTLVEGALPAGQYSYPWDGRVAGGAKLGSGLYFVRLGIDGAPARIARLALLR